MYFSYIFCFVQSYKDNNFAHLTPKDLIKTVHDNKYSNYQNANDTNFTEKSRVNLYILKNVIDFKNIFTVERRARTLLEYEPQALAFGAKEHALIMAIENKIISYDKVSFLILNNTIYFLYYF